MTVAQPPAGVCQAGPGPILRAVDRLVGGTTKGGTVITEDRMAHPNQDVTRRSNEATSPRCSTQFFAEDIRYHVRPEPRRR